MANIKDFATALIATAPSPANSGTSLVLDAGMGARMPAVPFAATIHPEGEMPTLDNAEKVNVTDVVVDTLTIQRAQGQTTAKNIGAGWRISNAIFAEDMDLSGLVPKTTAVNTLYGVNGSGNQASYVISQGSDTSSIAQRSSGGTLTVGTPTANAHATTKAYVDAADTAHTGNTSNPHSVTKAQVGLGNVDNTSDADKPVSTAQQTALNGKQDADATLTALAAHNTNGILTQTAADTFTGRTITGTTNQVTVTNGDGVSGNPTLSLPQNIHTGASPTFAGANLTNTSGTLSITAVTDGGDFNIKHSSADTKTLALFGAGAAGTMNLKLVDGNLTLPGGATGGVSFTSGDGHISMPGTAGLRLGNTSAAVFRLLPVTNDLYFQNTAASGNMYFSAEYGAALTGSIIFNTSSAVRPMYDSTTTLGTSSLYWSNTYTRRLYLNSTAYIDGETAGKANIVATDLAINGTNGATGSFTSQDGKTVTVTKGIITNIV